ncbi:MAG: hypothetical protein ACFFBD_06095, partial [Candidatus Hodarchaeota archaeon]
MDDQEICDMLMNYQGKNEIVYIDLRIEEIKKIKTLVNSFGHVRTEINRDIGHGLRCLKNGYWGFSSFSEAINQHEDLEKRISVTQRMIGGSALDHHPLTDDKVHQTQVNLTSGHHFPTEEEISEGLILFQDVMENNIPETVEATIRYESEEKT